ncbi:hypothetical protein LEP1GSC073_3128 [Leptospira noguchii str. Cascata]|nr:hypothetical protein LEP1GSC072_3086 [Leptospira noguchii str. Bonito]EMS82331.1 hypothetical protein LEP1GSC073_3128 [Leptospira noguchii str. Cascata]
MPMAPDSPEFFYAELTLNGRKLYKIIAQSNFCAKSLFCGHHKIKKFIL